MFQVTQHKTHPLYRFQSLPDSVFGILLSRLDSERRAELQQLSSRLEPIVHTCLHESTVKEKQWFEEISEETLQGATLENLLSWSTS